jgi:hypothetical protein
MPDKQCSTCQCDRCGTGHCDLNLEIVNCLVTKRPECPGKHRTDGCGGFWGCPALDNEVTEREN